MRWACLAVDFCRFRSYFVPEGNLVPWKDVSMTEFLSRTEAAEQLRVSPRSIDKLIKTGRLDAVRVGRRVLIPVRHIRRLAGAE
jgi:excisionase family DNA binding protein